MRALSYIKENGISRTFNIFYHYKLDLFLQKIILFFVKNKPLKNIIIIESHNDFDSNGGALYKYLLDNEYTKKYKIIWLLKNKIERELPNNVIAFSLFHPSIKKNYYICIAKYFTADSTVVKKVRENQKSFYFTHGSVSLKNVSGKIIIPDTVDYILTPSEFYEPIQTRQYSRKYPDKHFVCLGYPCQDILFQPSTNEIKKITKKKYSKKILWMPTFRKGGGYNRNDSTKIQPMGIPIIEGHEELLMLNDWLIEKNMLLIIKIHPMQLKETIKIYSLSNIKVLTGTDVKKLDIDNFRLMKDMDALISDYSSASYDFLMLNRPIGYDFSDLESYVIGLSVENVDDFIAGPKIQNLEQFKIFLKSVSEQEDTYRYDRQELRKKLYRYADNENCKRIVEFMGL